MMVSVARTRRVRVRIGCLGLRQVSDGKQHVVVLGVRDRPFHLGRRAVFERGQLRLTGPSLKVFVMRTLVEVARGQYGVASGRRGRARARPRGDGSGVVTLEQRGRRWVGGGGRRHVQHGLDDLVFAR